MNKTIEGLEKAKMRAYDIAVGTAAEHNAEPIDWGGTTCWKPGQGLFDLWNCTRRKGNWQETGKLALQIAELPEREEI